jgi:tripartite-type tricarboxylate transporter receptor subunit TctC
MKTFRPVFCLGICVLFLIGLFFAPPSHAYPNRPVNLIIKSAPGSGVDRLARFMAKLAPKHFGKSLVVIWKKGGGGAKAQGYVQRKRADGSHLIIETANMPMLMSIGKIKFKTTDWQAVIRMQVDPQGAAVSSRKPWKNFKDVAAWAKKNPGKLRWAGAHAIGNDPLTVSLLTRAAGGIKVKYIPHDSPPKMVAGLLGGHVDIAILNPSEAQAQVAAGKLRYMGVAHPERLKPFPDWPTFREQGFDVVYGLWRGVFVKAGTPKPIVDKIHKSFLSMLKDPEFIKFNNATAQVSGYMGGPEKFQSFFVEQHKKLGKILKGMMKK